MHDKEYKMRNRKSEKRSNVSTNWWILDIGFSNYTDKDVYKRQLLALFAFSTPGLPANPATREDACCKKAGTCTGKENKGGEDLMMENLSRQFIFISSYK